MGYRSNIPENPLFRQWRAYVHHSAPSRNPFGCASAPHSGAVSYGNGRNVLYLRFGVEMKRLARIEVLEAKPITIGNPHCYDLAKRI
jgi:hypothetical protein